MMLRYWVLVGQTPMEATRDEWLNSPTARIIAKEYVGKVYVSTVFLGIDHGSGTGLPILFETMVFGYNGEVDDEEWQRRTRSYLEAREVHDSAVANLKAGKQPW